jgi:hypothetical protein
LREENMDKKLSPDELAKSFVGSNGKLIKESKIAESDVLRYVSASLLYKRKVHEQGHDANLIITSVSPTALPETDPYRNLLEKMAQFLTSTRAEQIGTGDHEFGH